MIHETQPCRGAALHADIERRIVELTAGAPFARSSDGGLPMKAPALVHDVPTFGARRAYLLKSLGSVHRTKSTAELELVATRLGIR